LQEVVRMGNKGETANKAAGVIESNQSFKISSNLLAKNTPMNKIHHTGPLAVGMVYMLSVAGIMGQS